ncbi:MAG: glycosyltransferase family 9 protein, partial [Candidatus Omnitrophota bacterium]
KENRPVIDLLDIVPASNVIEIDPTSAVSLVTTAFSAVSRMRGEKIDAAIDMEFFSRGSAILAYLSGAAKRVGLHLFTCEGPYRGDLFTHKLLYNPYLHAKVYFASLVEALLHKPPDTNTPLHFDIPDPACETAAFTPSENETIACTEKIESLKRSPARKPVVILNPNSSDLLPIRKWPEDNFIGLGALIRKDFPEATIIITGAEKEKPRADAIASKINNAVSLAGSTTFRELLTLYAVADVLVTNDSGPAHFSTLTSVRSVILFGPETPFLYGSTGPGREAVAPNLVCSPCVNVFNHRNSPCLSGVCLKNISAGEVYKYVRKMILASSR